MRGCCRWRGRVEGAGHGGAPAWPLGPLLPGGAVPLGRSRPADFFRMQKYQNIAIAPFLILF